MKKIKILSLLVLSLVFANCSVSDGQKEYTGENLLFFDKEQTKKVILDGTTDFVTANIEFTTVKSPVSSYQVRLVLDTEKSTAVQGEDFDIVTDVVSVEAGVMTGSFDVKFYDATATTLGKKAVFTLQSDDLGTAAFNNTIEVTATLSCKLEDFPLSYDVEVYAFSSQYESHSQTFNVVLGQENTYAVNSIWGPNFVAQATGNPSFSGQYVYPGTIVINCDNSVVVTAAAPNYLGGTGTYDPNSGIIEVEVGQGLFTEAFTVQCIFYPAQ